MKTGDVQRFVVSAWWLFWCGYLASDIVSSLGLGALAADHLRQICRSLSSYGSNFHGSMILVLLVFVWAAGSFFIYIYIYVCMHMYMCVYIYISWRLMLKNTKSPRLQLKMHSSQIRRNSKYKSTKNVEREHCKWTMRRAESKRASQQSEIPNKKTEILPQQAKKQ